MCEATDTKPGTTMSNKMPKNWKDQSHYQSYYRMMGPITLEVGYSCISQTFHATLKIDGTIITQIFSGYKANPMTDDDYNSEVLKHAEREAKKVIKSWMK